MGVELSLGQWRTPEQLGNGKITADRAGIHVITGGFVNLLEHNFDH